MNLNLLLVLYFRFPVVSGFYKLLEVCMKICEKLSFFKVIFETMILQSINTLLFEDHRFLKDY